MAIPSGGGTEVLKRTSLRTVGGSATYGDWWYVDWTSAQVSSAAQNTYVPTNHIITVLSIFACDEETTASYKLDIGIKPASQTLITILKDEQVPIKGTFVWNDKFVLTSGDALAFRSNENSSGDNFSIYISYIDQDWS